MGEIVPLHVQKEEASEAKGIMMEAVIDGIFSDPKLKDKATKLFSIFAKPAFIQFLNMLGNDEIRFMVYKDVQTGLIVFHKFKVKDEVIEGETESSVIKDFSFTDPDPDKDIFTISEDDLGSIDVLIKKVATKFGMKMGEGGMGGFF